MSIRFDLRDWHDECTDNFIVYQYLAKLDCIQELSSTDIFDEAIHHCKLYSKRRRKEDKIAWLIHDREADDWMIFERHPADGKSLGFCKLS